MADPIFLLADEAATSALAGRLAALAQPGDVIALEGDLGAGKTAFARAFVRALTSPDEDVPSPTFTLIQVYDCDHGDCAGGQIWHFDLYRLEKPEDALELGVEDAFADGISLIEWPDRLGPWLPHDRLVVQIAADPHSPTARRIVMTGGPSWKDRLGDLSGE